MPGKVNPVIPEVVNQVAFDVIGNDLSITLAAEAGQLELNVMEPLIAFKLFTSINQLTNVLKILRERCIVGITANKERCRKMVKNSIGLVTALVPTLGYEKCSEIAKKERKTDGSVYKIVLEEGYLSKGTSIGYSPPNRCCNRSTILFENFHEHSQAWLHVDSSLFCMAWTLKTSCRKDLCFQSVMHASLLP